MNNINNNNNNNNNNYNNNNNNSNSNNNNKNNNNNNDNCNNVDDNSNFISITNSIFNSKINSNRRRFLRSNSMSALTSKNLKTLNNLKKTLWSSEKYRENKKNKIFYDKDRKSVV